MKLGLCLSETAQMHALDLHEISDDSKHKNFSREAYSFLKVKLRRLRRKMCEGKYDTRDKNLPTVLVNSSTTAGTGVTI